MSIRITPKVLSNQLFITLSFQVNTNPPMQSFHKLTVLSQKLVAPPGNSEGNSNSSLGNSESVWGYTTASPISHDYTGCCKRKSVSPKCFEYCDVKVSKTFILSSLIQ